MTESSKPRTWWIVNWGGIDQYHSLHATKQKTGFVHFVDQYQVIEKSAHDAALERIKLLEEKLKWLVRHSIFCAAISKAKGAEILEVPLIDLDQALASAREKIGGGEYKPEGL